MYEPATKGAVFKKWQFRVSKIHFFRLKDVSAMISEFYYVPKNISFYIFSMFFLLISGVGKSMFQNCSRYLFKIYPHIAWTIIMPTIKTANRIQHAFKQLDVVYLFLNLQ